MGERKLTRAERQILKDLKKLEGVDRELMALLKNKKIKDM